jgi:hypothetical protein
MSGTGQNHCRGHTDKNKQEVRRGKARQREPAGPSLSALGRGSNEARFMLAPLFDSVWRIRRAAPVCLQARWAVSQDNEEPPANDPLCLPWDFLDASGGRSCALFIRR